MSLSEPVAAPTNRPSAKSGASAGRISSQETGTASQNDAVRTARAEAEPEKNGAKTWLVLVSVILGTFLVALDMSIISTALPAITNEFNSLADYGWYGNAYLLTLCAFQLLFGKLYTLFPVETVLLLIIFLFEASSALCGGAPNSTTFIVGRAFCGIGAAGIFAGSVVCIIFIVPLHIRPKIQGCFGAFFGVASISGPLGIDEKLWYNWWKLHFW